MRYLGSSNEDGNRTRLIAASFVPSCMLNMGLQRKPWRGCTSVFRGTRNSVGAPSSTCEVVSQAQSSSESGATSRVTVCLYCLYGSRTFVPQAELYRTRGVYQDAYALHIGVHTNGIMDPYTKCSQLLTAVLNQHEKLLKGRNSPHTCGRLTYR